MTTRASLSHITFSITPPHHHHHHTTRCSIYLVGYSILALCLWCVCVLLACLKRSSGIGYNTAPWRRVFRKQHIWREGIHADNPRYSIKMTLRYARSCYEDIVEYVTVMIIRWCQRAGGGLHVMGFTDVVYSYYYGLQYLHRFLKHFSTTDKTGTFDKKNTLYLFQIQILHFNFSVNPDF